MKFLSQIILVPLLLILTACPSNEGEVTTGPSPTPAITANPTPEGGEIISGSFPTTATVGTLYEYTPTANVGSVAFSVENKPSWLTFTAGTGTLSGTPTSAGTFSDIKVKGTSGGNSTTLTFTVTVAPNDAFSGNYPTSVDVNTAYDFTPTILPGPGTIVFSIQNKPSWATFNTSTGRLNGTPTANATHSDIRVSATAGTRSNSQTFAITVTTPGATIISGSFPTSAQEEVLYDYTPTALVANPTFTIQNKPPWASFNTTTGRLSGYPTGTGTFSNVRVTGTKNGDSTTLTFNITVAGDPLTVHSWHLRNLAQSSFANNKGTSGEDMKALDASRDNALTGNGIKIAVSDSGLEIAHEDLSKNVLPNQSRNYRLSAPYTGDPTSTATDGDHGTSVSGIISAEAWNGKGGRGIAPKAGIAGFNFLYKSSQPTNILVDQANGDFDIFNQSWGSARDTAGSLPSVYVNQLKFGVTSQRNNKGSIYLKAAGNSAYVPAGGNTVYGRCNPNDKNDCYASPLPTNVDEYNTTPYEIVIAAMNAKGQRSSYSSIGSAIWVSGLGGEFGTTDPAIVTSDQSGNIGYSPGDGTIGGLDPNNNYTHTFNGTSSATPSVAGVVALMLEANPALTWRDVRHILAKTATKVNPTSGNITRTCEPAGYVFEQGWITNAANFPFHNFYGFGRVNAVAAINMAKAYNENLGTFVETNYATNSLGLTLAIPDNNKDGVTHAINVPQDLVIENVLIRVSVTHPRPADLAVELTSPSGTKSILMNGNSAYGRASGGQNFPDIQMISNAFYNERSPGNWTIRVVDVWGSAYSTGVATGTLTDWRIRVTGHAP